MGSWLGVGLGSCSGDAVGDGDTEGVDVGDGVVVGTYDASGASGFGSVKKGTKFTVPKLKSYLES